MQLKYIPKTLEFKHPFRIAAGIRTGTPVVFTSLHDGQHTGYGEASMPPYLGESHETVMHFLQKAEHVLRHKDPQEDIATILAEVDALAPGNPSAKASIDIALHDLKGKIENRPCRDFWKIEKNNTPYTTYTIGISSVAEIPGKVKEAEEFRFLKIKLGGGNDKEMIECIRRYTDKVLAVDVNQGWKEKESALDMIFWLKEKNVQLIEQPLSKHCIDDTAWLTERSPLPIFADESVQRYGDIEKLQGVFSGINIKLMKCTGLHEAERMIRSAKKLNMQVLIGCMSETSCAVSAAAQLTPLADWADLDGPLLIRNDHFSGVEFVKGKITLNDRPGIGAVPVGSLFDGDR